MRAGFVHDLWHRDKVTMHIFVAVMVVSGALADLDLRGWSALMGSICFALLLFRAITTWSRMETLARALAIALITQMSVAVISQLLLIQAIKDVPVAPQNPVGLTLVIIHRVGILVLATFWETWLVRRPARAVKGT